MDFTRISERYGLLKHIVFFYVIWALTEVILFPALRLKGAILSETVGPIWKAMVWVVPVIVSLKTKQCEVASYLRLNSHAWTSIAWSGIGIGFIVGYNFLMHTLFYANTIFPPWLTGAQWVNTVVVAGVVEEVLFRGYFLQKLKEWYSFWNANLLVSLLFVSIHFPIWYMNADKIAHGAIAWAQLGAFIFGFSLLQGWLFQKASSLWPCIMMHMVNNFMALALVG